MSQRSATTCAQTWSATSRSFCSRSAAPRYATHPGGANTISSDDIINGEVKSSDLGAAATTVNKLAPDAVTRPKIADDAVTAAEVADAAIRAPELATNAVTSLEVRNGELTGDDLGTGSVASDEIADQAVTGDRPRRHRNRRRRVRRRRGDRRRDDRRVRHRQRPDRCQPHRRRIAVRGRRGGRVRCRLRQRRYLHGRRPGRRGLCQHARSNCTSPACCWSTPPASGRTANSGGDGVEMNCVLQVDGSDIGLAQSFGEGGTTTRRRRTGRWR